MQNFEDNISEKKMFLPRWKKLRQSFYKTIERQIVVIREKPSKVSLGCALGIAVNFFPTLGAGFIVAFFLAALLRISKASAAVTSLLTGFLIPFMYALNFLTGSLILAPASDTEGLVDFIATQYSLLLTVGNLQDKIISFLELFGSTFLLGAVINAAIFGAIFYYFVNMLLKKLNLKHKQRVK